MAVSSTVAGKISSMCCGSKASCLAMFRLLLAATFWPSSKTCPCDTGRRPANVCIVSVLPEPFCPSTASNSPRPTSKSSASTSVRPETSTRTLLQAKRVGAFGAHALSVAQRERAEKAALVRESDLAGGQRPITAYLRPLGITESSSARAMRPPMISA